MTYAVEKAFLSNQRITYFLNALIGDKSVILQGV